MYESAVQEALIRGVVLDAIGDGVIATNCSRRIRYANRAILNRAGVEYDDLMGQLLDILIPESVREKHIQHMKNFCDNPTQRSMAKSVALPMLCGDGSVVIARTALGFEDHPVHGKILTAVLRWDND